VLTLLNLEIFNLENVKNTNLFTLGPTTRATLVEGKIGQPHWSHYEPKTILSPFWAHVILIESNQQLQN
jgi:hypothetical protein